MEMDEPIGWINIEKPVAFLKHEATKTQIAVYKKMNLFQRFMISALTENMLLFQEKLWISKRNLQKQ